MLSKKKSMQFLSFRFLSTLFAFTSVCYAKNITIDDRDPSIIYSTPVCPSLSECDPSKNWWISTSTDNPPTYSNGSVHVATAPGLSAQMTFQGATDIYLYTVTGPGSGSVFIGIDVNTPVLVNTYTAVSQHRVPTFHSGGLDPSKSHVITITITTSPPSQAPGYVDIDFFSLTIPDDPTSSASPASSTQGSSFSAQPKSTAPVGAIVGGILEGLLFAAVAGFLIYRNRRMIKRSRPANDWTISPNDIDENTPNNIANPVIPTPSSPQSPPEYDPYDSYPQVSQYTPSSYGVSSTGTQLLGAATNTIATPSSNASEYSAPLLRPSTKR